ncbi:hypothetical protein AAG570_013285 [Ranatra chinensis]|uniref:Carbohydrate kinase FGGY C-terminal domain-containing protein n=1 Tax=Ranatra chinensis TaxID=642074 RepID=A0ABD0YST1_9HEMI
MKITLGTGTFLCANTGCTPSASITGLYPVVGWRFKNELVYVLEGSSNDTGSLINWAVNIGLMDDPKESGELVTSVSNNDGVYFVPAFSGLQTPVNDVKAGSGFIGVKPTTKKEHLLRSILESIVFRVVQLYRVYIDESCYSPASVRVDGGVSKNDFVIQLLADLIGLPVERPKTTEVSAIGAAYLAGLSIGFWACKDELLSLNKVDQIFIPNAENSNPYMKIYLNWAEAVKRFCGWYNNEKSTS